MVRLSSVLATAATLFSTTFAISTSTSSGFVSSDGSVSFALNIPSEQDDSTELFFVLSGPSSSSWIAVGMGNNKMDDTLMFMMYADSTGNNITISPRLSYGHTEPSYTSNITYSVAAGSGISNGTMTANVICQNCRSWKGGSIDPTNTAAPFIFAVGPDGSLNSNSASAGIKRHALYGTFTMDLTKALGVGQMPFPATADSSGTVQDTEKTDHDFSGAFHACLMILAFVGLMPLGVFILRILNSPRWHGWNQALSAGVALLGVFLGIYCGTMYNRSRNFNSAHQIFGLLIIVAMIAQFVLGFMHHRMYKKTMSPTKLSPIHIWLGRIVIPAGIANGFLGFPFALNSKYDWALLALILLVIIVLAPISFWRWKRNMSKRNADLSGPIGYQAQPWANSGPSQSDINLGQMNYPAPYQHPNAQQARQFV